MLNNPDWAETRLAHGSEQVNWKDKKLYILIQYNYRQLLYCNLALDRYKTEEKLRPGKPKDHAELFGIEGSFRKLDIDW